MISSTLSFDHAPQKSETTFSACTAIELSSGYWFRVRLCPPRQNVKSFLVEVEAVFVLVIAEKLGEASPVDDRREHLLRRFVGQEHRQVLEHDLFTQRAIFLSPQQAHQVGKEPMLFELFAHDQLALVHIALD